MGATQQSAGRIPEYGRAPVEDTYDFWQEDDAAQHHWSCYQFEYEDDDEPVFSAFVDFRDDGRWDAEVFRGPVAGDSSRQVFDTCEQAKEWCSSWAWAPEIGQGTREYPDVLITGQERYDLEILVKQRRKWIEAGRADVEWLAHMNADAIADIVERILSDGAKKGNVTRGRDMRESGYTCPKCGNVDDFRANGRIENCDVRISGDGWDDGSWCDGVELPCWAEIACMECGHSAPWWEFDDGYARYEDKGLAAYVHNQLEGAVGVAGSGLSGLLYDEAPDGQRSISILFAGTPRKEVVVPLADDSRLGAARRVLEAVSAHANV